MAVWGFQVSNLCSGERDAALFSLSYAKQEMTLGNSLLVEEIFLEETFLIETFLVETFQRDISRKDNFKTSFSNVE